MLWTTIRKGRTSRLFSALLSTLLVLTLVSPGVAVFAEESTTTPVPDSTKLTQPVPPVAEAPVPEPDTKTVTVPFEEPAAPDPAVAPDEATGQESPVSPAPEAAPAPTAVPTASDAAANPKKSVTASVEVAPVTAAALAPLAVGPRDDFPEPITMGEACDLTTIAILWAGQNYEAGTVSASNDAENLYVTFATTGGWTMGLTHLYVGTTPPASYAPGSFPYQTTHDPAVTSYTYTIPLADIGAVVGDTIYIAAHAEVSNGEQGETAWAGTGQWPGLLFAHVVQECIELSTIVVVKFNDLDGNGEMDEGEPVLSGIDFSATLGEIVLTDTTDESGEAHFMDLAEGTYTIDETLPEGWVATTEIPLDVSVAAGQDVTVYVGNMEVVVEPELSDLTVVKFNDLDGNGEMDEGEPVLSGIDFSATLGEIVLTDTTDESGEAHFMDLAEGTYTIDETLPEGWVATTEIPLDVSVAAGQDVTVYVGNMEVVEPEDVTKTFRLFYPLAPTGITFFAGYSAGELSGMVELAGEGPYEGQVVFPHGTEITVSWYAMYGTELVLLGSGEPETLTMDVVNEFTYAASVAGFKFNDLDADGVWDETESGMAGWTISLYREAGSEVEVQAIPAGFELYAVTSTAADGSYLFSGLLPGTYFVAEEDREGWFMTVGPEGTFAIANGAQLAGLIFGNAEEPALPFTPPDLAIAKAAGVEEADPGQLITYTLTYRNVGEGVATDFLVVDDFDERYLAIVDSGGGEVVGGTIVWELAGPLAAADGAKTLVYTARLIAEMPVGITNVHNVVVISHPDDPNLTNNSARDVVVVDNPALPFTPVDDEDDPFLPFTGGETALLALMILAMSLAGIGLRFASRRA